MQSIGNVLSVTRGALLAFLVAACAGDEPAGRRPSEAGLRSTNACDFRDGGSRWAPGHARYETAAEFGWGQEHMIDLWGIATSAAGDVFVFDAGNTRVLELDSDLRLVDTFGRAGRGPGEFSYQGVLPGDWIAADDSSIFVLDLRTLSEFDLSGEFRRYVTREIPSPLPPRPIRRIAARYGRVVYVVDEIDRQDGTRTLQTWRIEPSKPHTLLRTDSMPSLPRSDGRVVTAGLFVGQADPLWAAHRRCAFISDGAGDWILRVDLTTNRADTLHLPSREIPELTEEDEAWLEQGRRAMARVGNPARLDGVEPTARLKWADLLVDPDGFVWLEPWRPRSMRDEPFTTWVVHPATGAVDSVVVERFPDAFLPGGAFVSRAYDRTEHVTLVRKYTLESATE